MQHNGWGHAPSPALDPGIVLVLLTAAIALGATDLRDADPDTLRYRIWGGAGRWR
jgi:hypothetical protein